MEIRKKLTYIRKSYAAFTPLPYRILMHMAVPLILILMGVGLYAPQRLPGMVFAVTLFYLYLEISLDTFLFGGIAAKEVGISEYLKSSHRGLQVMKNTLAVSAVKPLLMLLLINLAAGVAGGLRKGWALSAEAVLPALTLIFAAVFLIVAGMTVVRFFEGKMLGFCISAVAGILFTGIYFEVEQNWKWLLPVSFLLMTAVMVSSTRVILKRMKESYYDKGNE